MEIGEIAHAVRNGTLPGKDLRSGGRVSVQMECGCVAATGFSSALFEPGCDFVSP
jgi:hypothetical protein